MEVFTHAPQPRRGDLTEPRASVLGKACRRERPRRGRIAEGSEPRPRFRRTASTWISLPGTRSSSGPSTMRPLRGRGIRTASPRARALGSVRSPLRGWDSQGVGVGGTDGGCILPTRPPDGGLAQPLRGWTGCGWSLERWRGLPGHLPDTIAVRWLTYGLAFTRLGRVRCGFDFLTPDRCTARERGVREPEG